MNKIASWDGGSWSALGTGVNNEVWSLAVYDSALIAGGHFTQAGGVTTNRIASWSGGSWHTLGSPQGTSNSIQALLPDATGVIAAGDFDGAGSAVSPNRAARFDGSQWQSLGNGLDSSVRCLARHGTDMIAAGYFTTAGGATANRIARWNGAAWSALGTGMNDRVLALASLGGTLYAGGGFATAGGTGAANIAAWNGASWAPLGTGTNNTVYALTAHEGALVAGGTFTSAGGVTVQRLARWDGGAWSALPGMPSGQVLALGHYGGHLVAGGTFASAGGVTVSNIAIFDGTTWHPLGTGTNGQVLAMTEIGGRLYVGGEFTMAGGVTVNRLAVWDGTTWSALGSGLNAAVRALAYVDPYVYVGGDFTTAGGKPSNYIARWDGLLGACSVAVTQPTAAAELCGGLSTEIRWTYSGDCGGLVNLDLLHDGAVCANLATNAANTGTFTWSPTACAGTADGYAVRLTDIESGATATSGTFRILPAGALAVTAPNGGEHLVVGELTTLTWSSTACCGPLVRLELLRDGAVCAVLAESVANDGSEAWTPAQFGGAATGYRLRVTDLSSGLSDDSDGDFVIGPAYRIIAVSDVGGDQGGRLRVRWHREDNDQAGGAHTITQYSVWRRVESGSKGVGGVVPPEFATMAYPPGTWDFVTLVPAGGEAGYGTVCASLRDSTRDDGIRWTTYFVRAHTPQPLVFFDTLPDSGYSVDNLAPAVPTGLKWQAPHVLAWDAPIDPDFRYFTVYADEIGEDNRIDDTIGRSLDVSARVAAAYLVTATDCHGNEGPAATMLAASGVPASAPSAFALGACVPNPFNPRTTVSFDVPTSGRVRLRVFDVAGRLVRTLLDDAAATVGRHEVTWRGDDDHGQQVSAGVYFLRMETDRFADSRRMTLVK
ncbi:MAG: hypothetical protein IPK64_00440 [bacterium]|nr:hypothetical protein [bacterium]